MPNPLQISVPGVMPVSQTPDTRLPYRASSLRAEGRTLLSASWHRPSRLKRFEGDNVAPGFHLGETRNTGLRARLWAHFGDSRD